MGLLISKEKGSGFGSVGEDDEVEGELSLRCREEKGWVSGKRVWSVWRGDVMSLFLNEG